MGGPYLPERSGDSIALVKMGYLFGRLQEYSLSLNNLPGDR